MVSGGSAKSVTADEAYITRSIYDPNGEIVEGYARNLMQSYSELLTEEQVGIITEYLRELVEGDGQKEADL